MEAKERLYETVDGDIVREGDPRGAFLKYAVGDLVGTDYEKKVNELTGSEGVTSKAYTDDEARDVLRVRQANPTAQTRAIASEKLTGDETGLQVVLLHDRLATELADEARARANRGESLKDDETDTITDVRLYRTEDGGLVKEGDEAGVTLAYGVGDKVRHGDLDAFEAATSDEDDAKTETTPAPAKKAVTAPANKAQQAPANK